jgi:hypothetical protein
LDRTLYFRLSSKDGSAFNGVELPNITPLSAADVN